MANVNELLNTRIEEVLEEIGTSLDMSEIERLTGVLNTLYKLRIEENKATAEASNADARLELDTEIRNREMDIREQELDTDEQIKTRQLDIEEDKMNKDIAIRGRELVLREKEIDDNIATKKADRRAKYAEIAGEILKGVAVVGLQFGATVAGIKAYDKWFRMGLEFEETG